MNEKEKRKARLNSILQAFDRIIQASGKNRGTLIKQLFYKLGNKE